MKKIYLMLALAAGILTSCELETPTKGYLPDTEALQVPSNFKAARVSLYASLKGCVLGDAFCSSPELQADCFNAVSGYSNTLSDMYRWEFTTQSSSFSSVYGSCQGLIALSNWIIDGYNSADTSNEQVFDPKPTTNGKLDTNKGLLVARKAKGEAFFTRAYALFNLVKYFSPAYEESNADEANLGASYMLTYNPSMPEDQYPGRKTLKETYQQIYNDLDSADLYITQAGQVLCQYISVDAISALRARAALACHDWKTAWESATTIIDGGNYSLASSDTELQYLFHYDGVNINAGTLGAQEAIFQLSTSSASDLPGGSGGARYLPYQEGSVPDYIPTKTFLDMYSDDDYRKQALFLQKTIATTTGTAGTVYLFNKFCDHGYLYLMLSASESARYAHQPMMFRVAEMYLIAAEAGAQLGYSDAKGYLEELQEARIAGYDAPDLSTKEKLMAEIQDERCRELVGEGFRLFDLKRWHMPIKRGTPQQRDLCSLPGSNTTDFSAPADSKRMTWPIPKQEKDVNKNIVQNAGW